MALLVKNPPANAGDLRNVGSVPGIWKSPGGGHSNPLQYSFLKNFMDKGDWWAIAHRVTQSGAQRKQLKHRYTGRLIISSLSFSCLPSTYAAFLVAQSVKNLPSMQETWVGKEMAMHSSILAWEILYPRGAWWTTVHRVARVGHDLTTKTLPSIFYLYNYLATYQILEPTVLAYLLFLISHHITLLSLECHLWSFVNANNQ